VNGPEHLEILEPLGVDHGAFVARDTSTTPPHLVVVERVTRASPVPSARSELLRRGRALRTLEHPKVVRVRDVLERDAEVLVVSDYVDGEWLSSLMTQPQPPLGVMLRVVVDVLEGLAALHDLRDERDQPLAFVHGALGPDTVLVAEDGVAEIARACRLPRPGSNERYVAPELRRGSEPSDVRSDVYAAGSILRDVLADAPADATWAEPLTDIAWRACAVDPENRWPSALAMATTVRRVAGARLATTAAVAELMRRRFGERMRARRTALESAHDAPPPSSAPLSLNAAEMELVDSSTEPTVVQTVPPVHRSPPPPPPAKSGAVRPGAGEVPLALTAPAKKPAPVGETAAQAEKRRLGEEITPRGTGALLPHASRQAAPPPSALVVSDDEPKVLEAYRRQMPTFPTFEEEPPRRRRAAIHGMIIAGAIVLTFVTGWWLGRKYAPSTNVAEPALSATAPAPVAVTTPPTMAAEPAQSVASSTARPLPSSATPGAMAAAPPTPAPPTPAPTWTTPAAVRVPTPRPPSPPTADILAPRTLPEPKPASTHGGYVPEEL
jgi:Protein kinase domain